MRRWDIAYFAGWDSPVVRLLQRYFHPYLVMDQGIHEMNPPGSDPSRWPENVPTFKAGEFIERKQEVFNDGLRGKDFCLKWETRLDSATGPRVENGAVESLQIYPGFHKTVNLEFVVPEVNHDSRKLYLILSLFLDGEEVIAENAIHYRITG